MKRINYRRYIYLILISWTIIVALFYFHEKVLIYNDFNEYINNDSNFKDKIETHIAINLRSVIYMWVIGLIGLILLYSRLKKQDKLIEKANASLIESNDKFKTVFDRAKDLMFLLEVKEGEQYVIANINQSAIESLGYSRDEIIGMPIEKIIDNATAASRLERIERIIKGEQLTFESNKIRKDGSTFPVEVSIKLVKIGNKKFLHSVERNITERKQSENQLKTAIKKAEESDRLKSSFLSNMSHEIRTPMNGILGFTELILNNEISSEKRKQYIEIINDSGKHLIKIIDDIIDLSKVEANEVSIVKRKIKLNCFMNDLKVFFFALPDYKNNPNTSLEFKSEIKDGEDEVFTDDFRLKQILNNLISNALKFTEKGSIEIKCSLKDEHTYLFQIKDTGIGISEEDMTFIFDRFRQADERTKKRTYGGTGLGLAISKAYVELLGGEIRVRSKKGEGSVFLFTIPKK